MPNPRHGARVPELAREIAVECAPDGSHDDAAVLTTHRELCGTSVAAEPAPGYSAHKIPPATWITFPWLEIYHHADPG